MNASLFLKPLERYAVVACGLVLLQASIPSSAHAEPPELFGLRLPANWTDLGGWDPAFPLPGELPARFVWSEKFPGHTVRDQGDCGSCWAFGTVGALEYQVLINQRKQVDLSEQWLVSCNRDGMDCDGGFAAHNYFVRSSSYNDSCGGDGAVLESDFPYRAVNGNCRCPYEHHYWLSGWSYIGVIPGVFATDDQIKRAIYYYGPITAAINAETLHHRNGFTGVIRDCSIAPVNHLIVIVGWSDSLGAWRVRNSWGTDWGDDGEAWVAYGCSSIGFGANYVRYPAGRGTWVDFDYTKEEKGVFNLPYNTLSEGINALSDGGTLNIKAGYTTLTPTWGQDGHSMIVMSYGGSVVIGGH